MTRRPVDLDSVRFFVDENLMAVGLAMMELRDDVVVATRPPVDQLPTLDEDWIPNVGPRWVVITNDKHIRTRPFEAKVAVEHKLRCVHLRPAARNPVRWDFIRLIAAHWASIDNLASKDGPRWLSVTEARATELDYAATPHRLPPSR